MSKQTLIKQARNEYFRRYRLNNPEKIQEINERFWERKALELRMLEQEADQQEDNNIN